MERPVSQSECFPDHCIASRPPSGQCWQGVLSIMAARANSPYCSICNYEVKPLANKDAVSVVCGCCLAKIIGKIDKKRSTKWYRTKARLYGKNKKR